MDSTEPQQPHPQTGSSDPALIIPTPPPAGRDSVGDGAAAAMLGSLRSPGSQPGGGWQPPPPEEIQNDFPQHEILGMIGRGGMGAVYKAWQKSLDRLVAIKILPPGLDEGLSNFTERFKQEARAMAKFQHPGIVAVYDAGETPGGLLYFVMEFVEGTDVQRLLAAQAKLPPAQALAIAAHVCDALAYAHIRGVVHRDIKPSNIMVDNEGRVRVADFGLAKTAVPRATTLTLTNVAMGTPDFMAPEAMQGEAADARADIYSVGVMLYQMLTGRLPRGRFTPPSSAVPELDKILDSIVDRTLQHEPGARYSSAMELRSALTTAITRCEAKARAAARGSKSAARRLIPFAAIAVIAPAAFFLWPRADKKPPALTEAERAEKTRQTAAAAAPTAASATPAVAKTQPGIRTQPSTPAPATSPTASATPPKPATPAPVAQHTTAVGKWIPVRFSKDDHYLDDAAIAPDGSIKVHARLQRPEGVEFSGLQLRTRGPDHIRFLFGKTHSWIGVANDSVTPSDAVRIKSGQGSETPVTLQFATIGEYAYGWVDGSPLPPFRIVGPPVLGGYSIWSMNGTFSNVEIMFLDGLPEPDALKLLGIKEAPVPALPGWNVTDFSKMPESDIRSVSTPKVTKKDGCLHSVENQGFAIVHRKAYNVVARTTVSVTRDTDGIHFGTRIAMGLDFPSVSITRNSLTFSHIHAEINKEEPLKTVPLPSPLKPGTDAALQIAAIGHNLYAWLDGKLLGSADIGTLGTEGQGSFVSGKDALFRNLDYISLDGVPDDTALKQLGITKP
jgi:hypothetical protein